MTDKPIDEKVRTQEVYRRLSAPLDESHIRRTRGSETKKGYDTTGYAYQAVVDRLNETLGLSGWGFDWEVLSLDPLPDRGWEATVRLSLWTEKKIVVTTRCHAGGHVARLKGDALQGAITNALKKTAALVGVGRDAYLGTIDDDDVPLPESSTGRPTSHTSPVSDDTPPPAPSSLTITEKQEKFLFARAMARATELYGEEQTTTETGAELLRMCVRSVLGGTHRAIDESGSLNLGLVPRAKVDEIVSAIAEYGTDEIPFS